MARTSSRQRSRSALGEPAGGSRCTITAWDTDLALAERLAVTPAPRWGAVVRGVTLGLSCLDRLRRTLGYTETLERGYAVVRAGDEVLTRKVNASHHAALEIQFADGRLGVTPTGATPKPAKPVKKAAKPKPPGDQGSLF